MISAADFNRSVEPASNSDAHARRHPGTFLAVGERK